MTNTEWKEQKMKEFDKYKKELDESSVTSVDIVYFGYRSGCDCFGEIFKVVDFGNIKQFLSKALDESVSRVSKEKDDEIEKLNDLVAKIRKIHDDYAIRNKELEDKMDLNNEHFDIVLAQKEKEIKADRDRTIKEVEKEFIARMDRSNWVKGKDWFHLNHFKSILTDIKNKGEK